MLKNAIFNIHLKSKFHILLIGVLFMWILTIPFRNSLYQISIFFIIATSLALLIKAKDYSFLKRLFLQDKVLSTGLVLLLLSMSLSNYFGLDPSDGFELQIKFIYKYMLMSFALMYLYDKGYFSLEMLIAFSLISLSIHLFNGLYQQIMSVDAIYGYSLHIDAICGAFQNRNTFGLFMLFFSCILTIYLSSSKTDTFFYFMLILLLLSLYCLVFSYSRASWLAYGIFYLIVLFTSKNIKNSLFILLPVAVISILFAINSGLQERLLLLLNGFDSGRGDIWLWAIAAFKESWLLGYGMETMSLIDDAPDYQFVHNSVLEIAISLGFLGIVAYAAIASRVLITAFHCTPKLFAMGVALLTVSLFDQSILDGKRFIPMLMIYATFVMMSFHQKQEK